MIEKQYIQQLEKSYPQYLSNVVLGIPFSPISLRGGKNKPANTTELYGAIDDFLKHEKSQDKQGWTIEWEAWHSKTLGHQRWPASIRVETEEDYLHLIGKQKEAHLFKELVSELLRWKEKMGEWLAAKPQKVMELRACWSDICAVVDYLSHHDVQQYYIRSLPVPVHTKFLQQHQSTLLSILKHLQPERFPEQLKTLESALDLRVKPLLFPIRWLDTELARQYTSGIEILSVPAADLRNSNWHVREIWVVENETNLFLLPQRKNAIAVFSKGYALHDLTNIPLFHSARLFYWGDLDEDGFIMLHQFRQHYTDAQSILMNEETVLYHKGEMETLPFRLKQRHLQLTLDESIAYKILLEQSGRIEQEKLKLDFVQNYLRGVR